MKSVEIKSSQRDVEGILGLLEKDTRILKNLYNFNQQQIGRHSVG